jgi:hypothetical protein
MVICTFVGLGCFVTTSGDSPLILLGQLTDGVVSKSLVIDQTNQKATPTNIAHKLQIMTVSPQKGVILSTKNFTPIQTMTAPKAITIAKNNTLKIFKNVSIVNIFFNVIQINIVLKRVHLIKKWGGRLGEMLATP